MPTPVAAVTSDDRSSAVETTVGATTAVAPVIAEKASAQAQGQSAPQASRPRLAVLRTIGRTIKQAALDFGYLVVGGLTSVLAFAIWVAGVTAGSVLAITILGVFALIAIARVFRAVADIDRFTVAIVADDSISGVYRRAAPGSGWFTRLFTVLGDPQTWRDLLWLVLRSVLGFAFGVAAVTLVTASLGLITMPAWWTALPADQGNDTFPIDSAGRAWIATGVGVAIGAFTLGAMRVMAMAQAGLARALLAPSRRQELRARVDHLATTRADAVEAAQTRLERIERDLHDGAQARLVALAMELGIAEQDLSSDPEAARERIGRARDEALGALSELRDLARGLRPALLAERGVREAIESLAARSVIEIESSFEGDLTALPRSAETAAYFVTAEAIANAAKHSGASLLRVLVRRRGGVLSVEVEDDGEGGADLQGRGLDGLRRRVEALDGHLDVRSPAGGPTSVRAEIPCV